MKIVIDTNVMVSGVFFNGIPRKIVEMWFQDVFSVVCTLEILEEYEEVIKRIASKYPNPLDVDEIISLIAKNITVIENALDGKYSRDPSDDKFINCALSANATYVVSGDNDLLVLRRIEKVMIVSPHQFLEIVQV